MHFLASKYKLSFLQGRRQWECGGQAAIIWNSVPLLKNSLKLHTRGTDRHYFAGIPTAGKKNGDVFFLPSLPSYSVFISFAASIERCQQKQVGNPC